MTLARLQQKKRTEETARSTSRPYLPYKRALDLLICLAGLPFLLVLMGIIALMIMLDSPGSPFFIQERVGKDRRCFRMVKFRTMRCDYDDRPDREFMRAYVAGQLCMEANQEAALFKPVKKEHVTRVGKFLRKSSLDELPQLFNILKGEMSLVGPRPNVPWEVESYHDWHYERLAVLPGITGLAQVNGRSTLPFDQIVTYDIEYVRNLTWQVDAWILWRTFWIAVSGSGAG